MAAAPYRPPPQAALKAPKLLAPGPEVSLLVQAMHVPHALDRSDLDILHVTGGVMWSELCPQVERMFLGPFGAWGLLLSLRHGWIGRARRVQAQLDCGGAADGVWTWG